MDRLSSIPNCAAPDPSIKQKMEVCPDDDFTDVENFSQYIIGNFFLKFAIYPNFSQYYILKYNNHFNVR